MSATDVEFRDALHEFRRAETLKTYGRAILHNMGPCMVMGDEILGRIADCARAYKLGSREDLFKECKWDMTWELGDEVLKLVSRYVHCILLFLS